MRTRWSPRLILASLACIAGTTASASQQPDATAPSKQTFAAETAAIVVDVVVRDRDGRPVTDLRSEDFEIHEDGVRQTITAVTLVKRGAMAQPAGPPAASGRGGTAVSPQSTSALERAVAPTAVALVFDRLSPEGRGQAHRGALAYLQTSDGNDIAGVFLIDQSLHTIEPFTTDRARLKAALDAVALRATTSYAPDGSRVRSVVGSDTRLGVPFTIGAEHHGGPATATPSNPDPTMRAPGELAGLSELHRYLQQRLATTAERLHEMMMHEQQGNATAEGLLAIVDALGTLPGRKTMVFFAESLLIPPAVESKFHSVVAAANRANVSIYPVDAAGLRVHSAAATTATQLNAVGLAAVGDMPDLDPDPLRTGSGTQMREERTPRAWTKDLEYNEDILRQDPAASLGLLARSTGGFLINNTNDLERGFRLIDDDRRFHYLLAYTPSNTDFKGEYRRLAVKVRKRKLTVRSRSGYVASRTPDVMPVLPFEAPAIAALDRAVPPTDVPARGRAFSFPDPARPGQVAVVVTTDSKAIAFEMDDATQMLLGEFTIVARVKDAKGEVVRRASQPYRMTVPAGRSAETLRSEILFFRETTLPPGHYTLEYAVHDARGLRTGAGHAPFTVHDNPSAPLQVGSLVIIGQAERLTSGERLESTLLRYGDVVLYPNLGTPLRRGVNTTLPFSLVVRAAADTEPPAASVELRRDESILLQTPLTMPAADAAGRIQIVTQVPLTGLPAGSYTLRVRVRHGNSEEVREATFTLTQ
jgi:VWFA-related protein